MASVYPYCAHGGVVMLQSPDKGYMDTKIFPLTIFSCYFAPTMCSTSVPIYPFQPPPHLSFFSGSGSGPGSGSGSGSCSGSDSASASAYSSASGSNSESESSPQCHLRHCRRRPLSLDVPHPLLTPYIIPWMIPHLTTLPYHTRVFIMPYLPTAIMATVPQGH